MIKVHVRKKPDRPHLQLYYVDPLTGEDRTKSAKTDNPREAERAAAAWEAEVNQGRRRTGLSWDAFRMRFEDEHTAGLSRDGRQSYATAMNKFEALVGCPRSIADIDATVLSQFVAKLRKAGHPSTTVSNYVKHVTSALGWAAKMAMISSAPRVLLPREGRRKLMRSRPLTEAEFNAMIAAVPSVRPKDAERWQRYLRGLWLSGLRLAESLLLSWDSPPLRVDLHGRRPHIVMLQEGHKPGRDELVPITPDLFEFLAAVPEADRCGRVFSVPRKLAKVADVIRAIATEADVVTNETGKFASAHDFRRAFGTRWAMKVHPMVLQRLMRHRSIETTMKYYVNLDADLVADQVWSPSYSANPSPNQEASR